MYWMDWMDKRGIEESLQNLGSLSKPASQVAEQNPGTCIHRRPAFVSLTTKR
jgi:hypothetical protein